MMQISNGLRILLAASLLANFGFYLKGKEERNFPPPQARVQYVYVPQQIPCGSGYISPPALQMPTPEDQFHREAAQELRRQRINDAFGR